MAHNNCLRRWCRWPGRWGKRRLHLKHRFLLHRGGGCTNRHFLHHAEQILLDGIREVQHGESLYGTVDNLPVRNNVLMQLSAESASAKALSVCGSDANSLSNVSALSWHCSWIAMARSRNVMWLGMLYPVCCFHARPRTTIAVVMLMAGMRSRYRRN